MRASESTSALSKALAKFQAEAPPIRRDKRATVATRTGGAYSYTYADLETVIAVARPVLVRCGLAFAQEALSTDGGVGIVTRLMHESGEWLESEPLVFRVEGGPQAAGSAITYGRRYALTALLGIATEEDDDAQAPRQSDGPQVNTPATRETGRTARRRAQGSSDQTSGGGPTSPAGREAPGSPPDDTSGPEDSMTDAWASDSPPSGPEQLLPQAMERYGGKARLLREAHQRWGVATMDELTEDRLRELMA